MSLKEELFAQALADGKAVALAYKEAGYTGGAANARRKKADPAVKQKVADIIARREAEVMRASGMMAEEIVITRQAVIRNLTRIAEKAEADGQFGVAARCNEILGKDIGMFVERSVSFNLNADIDSLTDAELIAIAMAGRSGDSPTQEDSQQLQ
jgi:hypothetical protein